MKSIYTFLFIAILALPLALSSQSFFNGKEIPHHSNQVFSDPSSGFIYSSSAYPLQDEFNESTSLTSDTLYLTFFKNTETFALYSDSCSKSPSSFTWTTDYTEGYWIVPHGTYTLCADFWVPDPSPDTSQEHVVIYENVEVNGPTHLQVDSIAFNRIQTNSVDQNGAPLYELPGATMDHVSVFLPLREGYICFIGAQFYHSKKYFISSVSPSIKLLTGSFHKDQSYEHTIYVVEHPLIHGVDSSITLTNDPVGFSNTQIHFPLSSIDRSDVMMGILTGIKYQHFDCNLPFYICGGGLANLGPIEEWNGTVFLDMVDDTIAGEVCRLLFSRGIPPNTKELILTDMFEEINDSVGFSELLQPYPGAVTSGTDDTIFSGYGSRYYASWWTNNHLNPNTIRGQYWAIGNLKEEYFPEKEDQYYSLTDETGTMVLSGTGSNIPLCNVAPGIYQSFVVDSSYQRGGYHGTYSMQTRFDITRYNPDPPEVRLFRTTNANGKNVWNIHSGDPLFAYFYAGGFRHSVENNFYLEELIPLIEDSTQLLVKEFSGNDWVPLEPMIQVIDSYMGYYYKADVSGFTTLDSTALSFKLIVVDTCYNRTTMIIDPAVIIGDVLTGRDDQGVRKNELTIRCYPNPFTQSMDLTITPVPSEKPVIHFYTIQGKLIQTLTNYFEENGSIRFTWNGRDFSRNTTPHGAYLYEVTIGNKRYSGRVFKSE